MTKRALLSVSEKAGLTAFGKKLHELGYELVSTGGTAKALAEAGLPVTKVDAVTGFPEIFGGRVKTLHPAVHGGILFRRGHDGDEAERATQGIEPIDVVAVNLYPFRETVADPGVTMGAAVEQIDIGGPTMVRAAAKNHAHVAVVVDPSDYDGVAAALAAGTLDHDARARLAHKAFAHTAAYDTAIAAFFAERVGEGGGAEPSAATGPALAPVAVNTAQHMSLRYGENPHQAAALFGTADTPLLGGGRQLQGKELSYNNLLDVAAAVAPVAEFDQAAAVVVKHTTPCGIGAGGEDLGLALTRALESDPQSAFGGIVALNRPCDGATAKQIEGRFLEVIVAPGFGKSAMFSLKKKTNLRLIELDVQTAAAALRTEMRVTPVGLLVQSADPIIDPRAPKSWTCVTTRKPDDLEQRALEFLWRAVKHAKSNAIVIGSHQRTFGIGAGQMSRVDAVRIALSKSTGGDLRPICLASDAFFPFPDNVEVAADGGVTAIVQPGGSKKDDEVIAAANARGIAMLFTGVRHFRH